jgi:hypothetical protein
VPIAGNISLYETQPPWSRQQAQDIFLLSGCILSSTLPDRSCVSGCWVLWFGGRQTVSDCPPSTRRTLTLYDKRAAPDTTIWSNTPYFFRPTVYCRIAGMKQKESRTLTKWHTRNLRNTPVTFPLKSFCILCSHVCLWQAEMQGNTVSLRNVGASSTTIGIYYSGLLVDSHGELYIVLLLVP